MKPPEDPHHGVPLEAAKNYAHACERLPVWAGFLRDLGLARSHGVYIRREHGGWFVKIARQDRMGMPGIPQPRESTSDRGGGESR